MTQDQQPPGMRPAFRTPTMLVLPPPEQDQTPPPATEPSPVEPVRRGRGRPRTVKMESDVTPTPLSSPGRPDAEPARILDIESAQYTAAAERIQAADVAAVRRELPKIDAKIAVRAGVVAVGMVAMVAGWMVRRTNKGTATLRKPNKDEAAAIAKPIAAILARHVTKGEDMDDLFSIADVVMALDDYLDNGPLIVASVHPGQMPQYQETGS